MKNNKNLKVACGLLALVLLTTSVIGTTLARYTTADSASDTARVAKWGIELAVGGTLFGTDYAEHNAAERPDEMVAYTSDSVSGSANVVAPGTKNDAGLAFTLTGTPEVAYDVLVTDNENESIYLAGGYSYGIMIEEYGVNETTDISGLYTKTTDGYVPVSNNPYVAGTKYYRLHDALDLTDSYYPVKWTVKGTGHLASLNKTTNDLAALATEIGAAVEALEGDANDSAAASFIITWAWAIDGQNDAADTILGNLMATADVDVVAKNGGTKYYTVVVSDNVAKANGVVVANLDVTYKFGARVEQVD